MSIDQIVKNYEYRTARRFLKKAGEKLKIYRMNKGITQGELAKMCMCSTRSIREIEQGSSGIAIIHFFRYIVALNATYLFNPFEDIVPYPIFHQHKVKFRQRVKKKKV